MLLLWILNPTSSLHDQLIVLQKSSLFHFYPLLMLKSSQLGESTLHASPFTSSRSYTSPTIPHFTRTLLYSVDYSRLEALADHRSINTMMGCLESDARYQSQCSRSDIHQRHQQPFHVDFANVPGSLRTIQCLRSLHWPVLLRSSAMFALLCLGKSLSQRRAMIRCQPGAVQRTSCGE